MSVSKAISAPISSNPDVDLAQRHRYGDESAFEEVYQRHLAMVFNLCLRLCGEPSRAQDLSQEVFYGSSRASAASVAGRRWAPGCTG